MTTPLHTATTLPDLTPWIPLIVLTWMAYRLILIWLFPFAPCLRCHGAGRRRRGQYWRPCRWCQGTGRTVRLGRRIWHWVTTGSDHT